MPTICIDTFHHIGKYLFKSPVVLILNFLYEAEHQMFKQYSCADIFFRVVHELFVPPVTNVYGGLGNFT